MGIVTIIMANMFASFPSDCPTAEDARERVETMSPCPVNLSKIKLATIMNDNVAPKDMPQNNISCFLVNHLTKKGTADNNINNAILLWILKATTHHSIYLFSEISRHTIAYIIIDVAKSCRIK